jgi:hypothetical protein
MATNARTKDSKFFRTAGELLCILGNWNVEQLKFLKNSSK